MTAVMNSAARTGGERRGRGHVARVRRSATRSLALVSPEAPDRAVAPEHSEVPVQLVPPRVAPARVSGTASGERTLRRAPGAGVRPRGRRSAAPLAVAGGSGTAAACAPRFASRPALVLVVAGVCTALAIALLAVLSSASSPRVPERTAMVQVREGQTLSAIAEAAAPEVDDSAMLRRIQELNGLTSTAVRVGQPIVVPVSEGSRLAR
ncbi:LysM peptidoglycan-binding domain-containing protein [Sciscionella sediminilitoris]|uniref:LysM peptidoglycan-binding domain-containing protein n=1 Tax=Sciscionella sediminilitoris TaxID=1445613 RepID=UPI00068C86CD|nr:LysM peptidoglycan-binding domain-containing protein [Sciscionella sp. SE31]